MADRIIALLAIVLFLPFFLVIAVAIKVDSKGAIVFGQVRSGKSGAEFKIYKFRTMLTTEVPFDNCKPIVEKNSENVTRVGRFLRATKLDELPQLFNILSGDMSFIGPRPFLSSYIGGYDRWELAKFRVLPGLTGLAQVNGNGHLSTKERSYYDAEYAKHRNIFMDIAILYRTIMVVVKGEEHFIRHISIDAIDDKVDTDNRVHYVGLAERAAQHNAKRIAQVVGKMEGGVGICILNYFRAIDRTQYVFDFYTYAPSIYDSEIRALGGNVYYIPNFIKVTQSCGAFYRYIKDKDYYAVHANLTTMSVFPLWVARRAGVKNRICHAHSTTYKYEATAIVKNILKRFCSGQSTVRLACSRVAGKWLYGTLNEVTIIRNAIDLNTFKNDTKLRRRMRDKMGLTASFVVGTVGRLEYQKNQLFALEIFHKLAGEISNAKLIIVGSGALKEKLQNRASALGLMGKVIFVDNAQNIAEYYAVCDVFILPSRYEGLPLVGIEAQCMGVPCVFSYEITKEVDISNQSAFVGIHKRNIYEWIAAIESYKNKDLAAFSADNYNIKKTANALQSVYDNLLK
ncbi:MAG: sugar transferase [Bacillota bacterium]